MPKAALSDIMDHTIDGFAERFVKADFPEQSRYRAQICNKHKLLELIASKKRLRLEDIEYKDDRAEIKATANVEDFSWDWSVAAGGKYYFLPLEVLP